MALEQRRGYWKAVVERWWSGGGAVVARWWRGGGAVVAVAAKNARMAWAVLTKGESFKLAA